MTWGRERTFVTLSFKSHWQFHTWLLFYSTSVMWIKSLACYFMMACQRLHSGSQINSSQAPPNRVDPPQLSESVAGVLLKIQQQYNCNVDVANIMRSREKDDSYTCDVTYCTCWSKFLLNPEC